MALGEASVTNLFFTILPNSHGVVGHLPSFTDQKPLATGDYYAGVPGA